MASCLDIAAVLCDLNGLELRVRGQAHMFVPLGFEKDGEKVAVDVAIEVNNLTDEVNHLVEFRSPVFSSPLDSRTGNLIALLRSRSSDGAVWKTEPDSDGNLDFYFCISNIPLSRINPSQFRALLEQVMDETIALA